MKKDSTAPGLVASGMEVAWEDVTASFERFCLTAGIATLTEMMERDAAALFGSRHERGGDRRGYRWGHTTGKLGFHGGKIAIDRARVRARSGSELALPSWEAAQAEDRLRCWAMNPDADQRLDASLRARCACRKATSRPLPARAWRGLGGTALRSGV